MEFKQSELECYVDGKAFDSDNYRVVFYEFSSSGANGTYLYPDPHWNAYKRFDSKGKPLGRYVDTEHTRYQTKEDAIQACINDLKVATV
jgi:hypothetical protein